MWDLIVSVPDHCLSFYLVYVILADVKCSPRFICYNTVLLQMPKPSTTNKL